MVSVAVKAKSALPEFSSIEECFTVGEVIKAIPRESIDRALCSIDRSKRREGRFPDHLVVYFVIFMALFMELSYVHVLEKIKDALGWLYGTFFQLQLVTDAAIVQARQRLGSEPLRVLFKIVAKPLATVAIPSAFFRNWRIVIIDGVIFDVEDTRANSKAFGRSSNRNGGGAYPQVRCVALIEYATRAVIDLVFGPYVGSSEQSLSKEILGGLKPGMLCLADRLYPSFAACQLVINSGGQFVWRVSKTIKLKAEKRFSDGSYLAKLNDYDERKRYPKGHMVVRVVEYKLPGSNVLYRLITSILDPKQAPAGELSNLYPKRWSQETFNSEIKKVLRQPRIILRSKSPDLVIQELYGLFLAHFVVRFFMFQAAMKGEIEPEALSFKHSVFVIKNHLPILGNFFP